MVEKIRLGVIFGGRSGEHEVSLMSARSVLNAINTEKYEICQIAIDHSGNWLVGDNLLEAMTQGSTNLLTPAVILADPTRHGLYAIGDRDSTEILRHLSNLDVVFPVLHGTFGEDGTIQGLLELADLAYVGAGVLGSSLGMDKGVFKDVMRANNIPVLDYFVTTRREIEDDINLVVGKALKLSDFPLFIKPANLGSSVGITKCKTRSDVLEGLLEAARYDRRVLVERGINAREIEVSVLGNEFPLASIPGEVIPCRDFYSYEAKYIDGDSELLIPAPISKELVDEVQELAVKAYRSIDCAGMARVDFLLDKQIHGKGKPPKLFLNEINTLPGFTQISMYPKLWEISGLPYAELIDRLIELAMERKAERDHTERRFRREV